MYGARNNWLLLLRCSKRFRNAQTRRFCSTNTTSRTNNNNVNKQSDADNKVPDFRNLDAYRDLDNLDFMKAAKILFTTPPKPKKFGLDFHLVQLFFCCLPSLAVYLVAQYARHEMKKMDMDLDLKKKMEEEKAKEMEASTAKAKEKEAGSLREVKERLEALEETIKEIVVEAKRKTTDSVNKNLGGSSNEKDPTNKTKAPEAAANQPTLKGIIPGPGQNLRRPDVATDVSKQEGQTAR